METSVKSNFACPIFQLVWVSVCMCVCVNSTQWDPEGNFNGNNGVENRFPDRIKRKRDDENTLIPPFSIWETVQQQSRVRADDG